jgi:chromosomal replication initiator protein
MLNPQKIWQGVLGELELILSKANFTTWFKNTFIIKVDEEKGETIIGVPNAFTKSWMEKKYNKHILEALNNVCKSKIKSIIYQIQSLKTVPVRSVDSLSHGTSESESSALKFKETVNNFGLNSRYTFANFIVGAGNQLAHSASMAIIEEPGIKYNPLFLYGDVGLGKTHLMQAIGHALTRKFPDYQILYVNFEKFTNDYVAATRRGQFDDFRRRYRTVDALLVDDVQFMIDKEKTQDEFFQTFEILHQNDKQMVITSDRPPKALVELQDRMISRFEWGMIADVKMPDLETRVAILENKCQERGFKLEREIINYLAENIKNSIRELEGALNKVIAWYDLKRQAPTIDLVREILTSLLVDPAKKPLNINRILKTVAEFYEIDQEEITGASRKRQVVVPRQIVMYLMRQELDHSYPAIGASIGGRDHTTAMYACQRIEEMIEEEERIRQEVESIRQRLYGLRS